MLMYTLSFETPKHGVDRHADFAGTGQHDRGYEGSEEAAGTIEVDESVAKMLVVIDGITAEDNGKFLNYEEGRVVGW